MQQQQKIGPEKTLRSFFRVKKRDATFLIAQFNRDIFANKVSRNQHLKAEFSHLLPHASKRLLVDGKYSCDQKMK